MTSRPTDARDAHAPASSRAQSLPSLRFIDELRPRNLGNGEMGDQHGRDAETCRGSAVIAERHAEHLRAAVADLLSGAIVLGRLGGGRQVQRLEMAAELFDTVVTRDNRWADLLDEINEERA